MKTTDKLLIGAGIIGLYLAWRSYGDVKAAIASGALDPTSTKNIAYGTANKAGAVISGEPAFNLGAKIWEWTHPKQAAAEKAVIAPTAPQIDWGQIGPNF